MIPGVIRRMKKSIRNPYGYIHTYKRGASVKSHFRLAAELVPSVEVPGFELEYHQAKNNLFMNSNSYHGANVFFTLHFSLLSFCLCQSFTRFKLWPNSCSGAQHLPWISNQDLVEYPQA